MRHRSLSFAAVLLAGVFAGATGAAAAAGVSKAHQGGKGAGSDAGAPPASGPEQLRNKTIVLGWREYRVQKADAGDISRSITDSVMSVYVSSAGRLFTRLARRDEHGHGTVTGHGPEGDEKQSGTGAKQLNPSFDGQELNIITTMDSGARDIKATFEAGFGRCSLQLIFGKDNGEQPYHQGMDGRMYHIISTDISATSCAIRDGNAIGD